MSVRMTPLALAAAGLAALALSGCADGPPRELSERQVCLSHFDHDPVEQERCRQDPELRKGAPPEEALLLS